MKLSIIIPVFEVEEFLDECIESLMPGFDQDMEIILVDDASPDKCGEMCDKWATKEQRITVIHHPYNMGLSEARNTGINISKGDYIAFVDSDDFVEPYTFQKLLSILVDHKDIDILEFPVMQKYGDKSKENLLTFPDKTYDDMLSYWFETKAYLHMYAWNKVVKKSLYSKVLFPAGKKFEDAYTYPRLLRQRPVVATTHVGCYYYRWNHKGITATADGKTLNELLSAHIDNLNELRYNYSTLPQNEMGYYYHHILNIQLDVYERMGTSPRIPILPYNQTLKLKLLHLLGINKLCKLSKILHKIRPPR